jgi:hypothetical protein
MLVQKLNVKDLQFEKMKPFDDWSVENMYPNVTSYEMSLADSVSLKKKRTTNILF